MALGGLVSSDNGFDQLFRQLVEMDGEPEPAPAENEGAIKASEEQPEDKTEQEDAIEPPNPPPIEVVKAAQEDILQLDVLVCGKCQNVYHFIEAFSEHKNSNECDMETQVFKNDSNDPSELWAFLLWKACRTKDMMNQTSPDWSSCAWNLHQRWRNLAEDVRKTWIEAGKSLKSLTQIGRAKIELQRPNVAKINKPVKTTMTVQQIQQQRQTLLELQKELEDDETEMMSTLGLIRGPKSTSAEGKNKKVNDKDSTAAKENEMSKSSTNKIIRKSLRPKADGEESEEEEYTVEKIVAKRVDPNTKEPDYLLKWKGFPSQSNTWEPFSNMGTCTKLVEEFERNLERQRERKAMEASKLPKNVTKIKKIVQNSTPLNANSRPVRSSAKKALDHFKEWVNVGTKRKYESEDESDADDPKPKKQEIQDLTSLFKKKILGNANSKTPVLVANSKGVVRVDPEQVPNLSSGVYILSSQSGLIKVDDPTAQKLTEAMKSDGKKFTESSNSKLMINETEIRKIPAKNVQPKIRLYKKDQQTGIIKKDSHLSPSVKIIQKSSMNKLPLPLRLSSPKISQQQIISKIGSPKSVSTPKQIILGQKKTRPLPGPIPSPLRPPILKPKVTIRTAPSAVKKPQHMRLGTYVTKANKDRLSSDKFSDDDFDGGLPDEFPKADEPIAPPSPTRPLTLCPLTGEVLGKAEGEKTPPAEDENILPDIEDDGMMRVEMSPGGTIRQIITKPQQRKQQSVLQKKQQIKVRPTTTETANECLENPEQELISIEGEGGIIYQMTPEQQQMLINNGTFRVDSRVIQDESTVDSENTEIVISNGQIIQRTIQGNGDENSQDGSTILMQNDSSSDQIILQTSEGGVYVTQEGGGSGEAVLTLDSAVQEAIATGTPAAEGTEETEAVEDEQQMVAQIVQAEPPTPGGGPRKVVLLLPDGSLIHTEMDEDQYQALEFEK